MTQVALSLLLVAGATLFLRTFRSLLSVDLGFDADRVLIASVEPRRAGLKGEAAAQFYRDLQARLRALPGVESGSATSEAVISTPLSTDSSSTVATMSRVSEPLAATVPTVHTPVASS